MDNLSGNAADWQAAERIVKKSSITEDTPKPPLTIIDEINVLNKLMTSVKKKYLIHSKKALGDAIVNLESVKKEFNTILNEERLV